MWALDMEVYFTRTLTYPNNSTGKESIPHWFNGRGAINSLFYTKIATSAVSLAQILQPKKVLPISFWEQCSNAPPLFKLRHRSFYKSLCLPDRNRRQTWQEPPPDLTGTTACPWKKSKNQKMKYLWLFLIIWLIFFVY